MSLQSSQSYMSLESSMIATQQSPVLDRLLSKAADGHRLSVDDALQLGCRRLVGRSGAGGRYAPQPVASRPAGFVHRRAEHQLHERLQRLLPLLRLLPRPWPPWRLYAQQRATGRQDRRDRSGRRHPDPAPGRAQPRARHRLLRRPVSLAEAAVPDGQSPRSFGRRNPARLQGFQPVDRGIARRG